MAPGNDHYRAKPTERRSSDRDRARPHESHQGHSAQSGKRQSLSDQLLSAAREQGHSGEASGQSGRQQQEPTGKGQVSESNTDANTNKEFLDVS